MIGEISEKEIEGKTYKIIKGGVSTALEIQSVFHAIIKDGGVSLDKNTDDINFGNELLAGMTKQNVRRIKEMIIEQVQEPKMDSAKFEILSINAVTTLFMEIYAFHIADSLKKNPNSEELPEFPTENTNQENSEN